MRCLIGQYQRNSKKGKSGAGAEGDPKWPYFNMFAFLKDKCTPRSYCQTGRATADNEDSLLQEEDETSINSDQSPAGHSKSTEVVEQPILKQPAKPGPKRKKPSQMVEDAYHAMKKSTKFCTIWRSEK
ncbi:hypothetical protein J6590_097488 [Homalodisca vitripennis]|nr:hypothetical protein J6590_097488 [Homalodisca vitripennis]